MVRKATVRSGEVRNYETRRADCFDGALFAGLRCLCMHCRVAARRPITRGIGQRAVIPILDQPLRPCRRPFLGPVYSARYRYIREAQPLNFHLLLRNLRIAGNNYPD